MELLKDTPFEVAWQVWKNRSSKHCLTVVIKGTYELVASGECPITGRQQLPTGDVHHDGDPEASVRIESDFAYIKPKGECFVVGSCYAPGKVAAPVVLAAFTIGQVSKRMAVIGDRHFRGLIARQTDPEPFKVMPLCWERSFGGIKSPVNPVGLGLDKIPIGEKKKRFFPLPNIENPDALIKSRRQNPPPVGSFPIPKSWKQRVTRAGRYDRRWLDSAWPGLPEDFQWSYFNAAPVDQQISGYFKGNESISLINLHREHQRIECRLPGHRATAVLVRADGGSPDALRPDLDTITVDTDAGTVTCLWRAIIEVGSPSLDEYSELFVVHEDRKADLSIEEYVAWIQRRKEELTVEEKGPEPQPAPDIPEVRADEVAPVVIPKRKETGATAQKAEDGPEWGGKIDVTSTVRPVPVPLDSPISIVHQPQEESDPLLGGDSDVEATVQSFISGEPTENADMRVVMTLIAEEKEAQSTELSFQDRLDEAATLLGKAVQKPILDDEEVMLKDAEAAFQGSKTLFKGMSTSFLDQVVGRRKQEAADQSAKPAGPPPVEAGGKPGQPDRAEMLAKFSAMVGQSVEKTAHLEPPPAKSEESLDKTAYFVPTEEKSEEPLDKTAYFVPTEEKPEEPLDKTAYFVPTEEKPEEPLDKTAYFVPTTDKSEARDEKGALQEPPRAAEMLPQVGPGDEGEEASLSEPPRAGGPAPGSEAAPVVAVVRPPIEDEDELREKRSRVEAAVEKGESCAGWDLSDVDLSGLNLRGVDLSGALLLRADLTGANLDATKLDDAVLFQATLRGASLRGTSFNGANLQSADASEATLEDLELDRLHANGLRLREAKISRCNVNRAALIGVDLTKARVDHSHFDGADLSESKLDGALFEDCTLIDTDISGSTSARNVVMDACDLTKLRASDGVDLSEASMVKAKLGAGRFGSAKLVSANFSFSTIERADFSRTDLTKAILMGCRLASSRFDEARLVDTRFGKSDMPGTKFDGAALLRADFRGCNLYGAEFFETKISDVQLELANVKGTKLA